MSTEKERAKLVQERADAQWAMETVQGRRFLWRLISLCGVYQMAEGDTNQILIQEGMRRTGLSLVGILTDASQDSYFKMMQEAMNREVDNGHSEHARPEPELNHATGGYDHGPDYELPEYDRYTALDSFL